MSSLISFQGDGRPGDEDSSNNGDFFVDHPAVAAIFCYGWLLILFYCLLCRKTRERPSTAVGDSIRARAREYRERLEHKKAKLEQSPEERNRLVDDALHTKVVLSKDAQGNMILGSVGDELPSSEGDAARDAVADVEAPRECTECPAAAAAAAGSSNTNDLQMDEDEDCMCVICLDSFEPGDMVSWSKHDSNCTHVFHTECIRQWLVDRRQDECPACRCCMVKLPDTSESDLKKIEGSDNWTAVEEEEVDTAEAASAAQSKDEPSFFVIMHGLISRTIAPSSGISSRRARRALSAPTSGQYNLVSVDSDSFDSQDGHEQVQDLEGIPPQHDDVEDGSASSSSSSSQNDDAEDEESDGPRWLPSQAPNATVPISEALRRSEVTEDDDEETTEDAENPSGGRTMELDVGHAVTDIVFSH